MAPSTGQLSWLAVEGRVGRWRGQVAFLILKCWAPHPVLGRCWKVEVQKVRSSHMQRGVLVPNSGLIIFDNVKIQAFSVFYLFIFSPSPEDIFFIDFRERERGRGGGREGEREKQTNIDWLPSRARPNLQCTPGPGSKPATWVCALNGNQTDDLLFYGTTLQPTDPHWPGPFGGKICQQC